MGLTPFVTPAWLQTANVALAPLAILVIAASFVFMVSATISRIVTSDPGRSPL